MKKIFLAFVVINAFSICGMPKQSQSDEPPAVEQGYKLHDIRFMRPVISFGPTSKIWTMKSFKYSNSTDPEEISSIMATKKGEFGLDFCMHKYKIVDFDKLLQILDKVESHLNLEWLGSYEFSVRILPQSNRVLIRWLLERNNVKDVYIRAIFFADLSQKLLELKLENDRTYYHSGKGEPPALIRDFLEILKSGVRDLNCVVGVGDYDFQEKVFTTDTMFELAKN